MEKEELHKTWYSKEYEKDYDFVGKCNSGVRDLDYKFHCEACNIDLSCAGGGLCSNISISRAFLRVTKRTTKQ